MTDIVERLRRDAARFAALEAAGDQPWVADAAWAADDLNAAADEIERLRAAARGLYDACEGRANAEGGDFGCDIGPAAYAVRALLKEAKR